MSARPSKNIFNLSHFYTDNIYIADTYNQRIRKVTVSTGIIVTIAGSGSTGFGGDNGAATSGILYDPIGVAVDSSGVIIQQTKIAF